MPSVFDDSNYRANRFKALKQYADDIARSKTGIGNETAPEPAYNPDYPTCAECNRPFFHDYEERKYRCNFCIITVKEDFIQYSPHNKNRKYKDLAELAAESKNNKEAQELVTAAEKQQQAIRDNHTTSNIKIKTQAGDTNDSSYYSDDSSNSDDSGNGKPVLFQLESPHDIIRKQRMREAGIYADHTRTSVRDNMLAEVHPLDKDLVAAGYQIREVKELPRQFPNSPGIVPKDKRRGEHRPYSRYGPDTGEPDVYDGI